MDINNYDNNNNSNNDKIKFSEFLKLKNNKLLQSDAKDH